MVRMLKILVIFSLFALSSAARADAIPSFVFVKNLGVSNSPEFLRIPRDARELGIARIVDPSDAQMRDVLNMGVTASSDTDAVALRGSLERIRRLQRTDAIVYAPEAGKWQVYASKNGTLGLVAEVSRPGAITRSSLINWFIATLGYNAIVTGYNGDQMTISTPLGFFNGQQAIAYGNSHDQVVFSGPPQIRAILEAQGNSQGIAFFRAVWRRGTIPIGTKVVLENSKN